MPGNNRMTGQQAPSKVCVHTFAASVAVAVGDLLYKSTANGQVYPMSSFTWTTNLATTRFNAARQFAGLSNERRLSTETDTPDGIVYNGGEALNSCAALASAAKAGELVTFGDNGDSTLSKTTLAITTDPSLAIGRLSRPAAVGATQLYWVFDANVTNEDTYGDALPNAKYTTAAYQTATFAAGDLTGAKNVNFNNTGTTPGTLTTRTGTQMFNDTPGAHVGMSYMLFIRNSSGSANTLTVGAGADVTLTGTMTIAQNTTRMFIVTFTSATTVTIQSMGLFAAGA